MIGEWTFAHSAHIEPEGYLDMKSTVRNLFATCLAVGAAGLLSTPAFAADAAAGKALFATKCKSCHGADGTPPAAMTKVFSTIKPLSDPAVQGKSDGDLKTSITKGVGKMKPQAVSDGDADNLSAYVRTLK
jgi:mono/diheme cytochrome c family protein